MSAPLVAMVAGVNPTVDEGIGVGRPKWTGGWTVREKSNISCYDRQSGWVSTIVVCRVQLNLRVHSIDVGRTGVCLGVVGACSYPRNCNCSQSPQD